MDDIPHEERMRRLQRIAYGAVASDAERAAALAELEALSRAPDTEAVHTDDDERAAGAGRLRGEQAEAAPPSREAEPAPAADGPAAAARFKWAIAAAMAALVVGIAVGWQVGLRHHELDGHHLVAVDSADIELSVDQVMPVPIESAPAARVFARAADPTDAPLSLDRDDLLVESFRLLSTRSDGVRIYAARTLDSANVCVVIALPSVETPSEGVVSGGSGSACTSDGRFPGEGLTIGFSGQGRGAIRATWGVDGSVSVSPADSASPVAPNAAG